MAASCPALRRAAARACPLAGSLSCGPALRVAPPRSFGSTSRAGPERLCERERGVGAEPQVRLWEPGPVERRPRSGGCPMPDALPSTRTGLCASPPPVLGLVPVPGLPPVPEGEALGREEPGLTAPELPFSVPSARGLVTAPPAGGAPTSHSLRLPPAFIYQQSPELGFPLSIKCFGALLAASSHVPLSPGW